MKVLSAFPLKVYLINFSCLNINKIVLLLAFWRSLPMLGGRSIYALGIAVSC